CLLLAFGRQELRDLVMFVDFLLLVVCRALQAALVFALALLLPRYPGLAVSGYAVPALERTGLVLVLPIYFLRPDIATITVMVLALMLLAMFLLVPNRLKLTLLSAAVGGTRVLVSIWSRGLGAQVIIGRLIVMPLPVVTGFFAPHQLHTVQRRPVAMSSQARRGNRELRKDLE